MTSSEWLGQLMQRMPSNWQDKWCHPPEGFRCVCIGCANVAGKLNAKGFVKEEWEQWKKSQQQRKETE